MENSTTPSSSPGWRRLRRCVIGCAILLTVIALIYVEEDVRGRMAWASAQRKCAASGVDLNLQTYIPAVLPDDENFAATPFFAPLFDLNPLPLKPGQSAWRDTNAFQKVSTFAPDFYKAYDSVRSRLEDQSQPMTDLEAIATAFHKAAKTPVPEYHSRTEAAADLLRELDQYSPVLDELRSASARPYARFDVRYEQPDPTQILLPHLFVLKKVSLVASYRASAELALGKTDEAFKDLQLALSTADVIRTEPIMISHLVRIAILSIAHRIVWEGLATHAWSDQQLQTLQDRFSRITILADSNLSAHAELGFYGAKLFETMHNAPMLLSPDWAKGLRSGARFIPSGWIYLEQSSYANLDLEILQTAADSNNGVIHPKPLEASIKRGQAAVRGLGGSIWHHRLVARMLLTPNSNFYQRSAFAQALVNETVAAIALERYRRANGQFASTLGALVPQYLTAVPRDVITGEPLKYQPTGANQFLLYSVGWNETDDGGRNGINGRARDLTKGDWAWEVYP